MKKSTRVSALLLATAAVVMAGLWNKSLLSPRVAAQQDRSMEVKLLRIEQSRRLHAVPEIVSAVPSLRLVHAEIVSRGSFDYVRLTLRNESPKSIVSFTICSQLDEYGYSSMSIGSPDEDLEVLAPYAETTVESAGSVEPGKPLTLCAVMFADETQEGVERVTYSHKQSRDKAKGRRPKQ